MSRAEGRPEAVMSRNDGFFYFGDGIVSNVPVSKRGLRRGDGHGTIYCNVPHARSLPGVFHHPDARFSVSFKRGTGLTKTNTSWTEDRAERFKAGVIGSMKAGVSYTEAVKQAGGSAGIASDLRRDDAAFDAEVLRLGRAMYRSRGLGKGRPMMPMHPDNMG